MPERRPVRRPRRGLLSSGLALLLIGWGAAAGELPEGREAALERLVRQDCGSCHGMRLSGGLGPDIRGPALEGHAPEGLARIILDGVPGTAMPPWRPLITEEDALWIARYLLNGESKPRAK